MIEIISGTNRPRAKTRILSGMIERLYKAQGADAQVLDLIDLPLELYAPDSYKNKPPGFLVYQDRVLAADGLHVVVPEYNGSFPGALKYFIDMLKFPECFEHKPVTFTGLADGVWGGIRAVEQLQMVFNYRNAYILPERVWFPRFNKIVDEKEHITDDLLRTLLEDQVKRFIDFSRIHGKEAARVIAPKKPSPAS
jgi:chromate reductase